MKRIIFIFCFLSAFHFVKGQSGRVDSTDYRFNLLGFAYTRSICTQNGIESMTYSYDFPDKGINGCAVEFIHHGRSPRLAFHVQVRYVPFNYTYYTSYDSRYPYPSQYPYWRHSEYQITEHIITAATYLSFTTKAKNCWLFVEGGPEFNNLVSASSIEHETYQTSLVTHETYTRDPIKSGYQFYGLKFGFRIGFVLRTFDPIYISAIAGLQNIGRVKYNSSPGMGTVASLNFGIYYRLPVRKKAARTHSTLRKMADYLNGE